MPAPRLLRSLSPAQNFYPFFNFSESPPPREVIKIYPSIKGSGVRTMKCNQIISEELTNLRFQN